MRLRTEGVAVFDCRIDRAGEPTRFREEGVLVVFGVRCRACRWFYRMAEGNAVYICCENAGMMLEHHRADCDFEDRCGCLD